MKAADPEEPNAMKTHRSFQRPGGFSLMELLVVIVIIVILAGLTVGGYKFVSERQAKEKAKVQLGLLQVAIEDFHSETGMYPGEERTDRDAWTEDGKTGTKVLTKYLFPTSRSEKVYLVELDPDNDQQGWREGALIVDPWGNPYRYRANRPLPNGRVRVYAANPGYDIWSSGPDGESETSANGGYDPDDDKNKDDIGW